MNSLRYLLALLVVFNASILLSQEATEPPLAPLELPTGTWRSTALDSAMLASLTPKNLHQVTYYDDGSFAAVHRLERKYYRIFVTKDGKVYHSVYITKLGGAE